MNGNGKNRQVAKKVQRREKDQKTESNAVSHALKICPQMKAIIIFQMPSKSATVLS